MTNCYHQELTPLVVCKVKINNRLKTFEKTMTNKKVVRGLHKMFLKEKNIHAVFLLNFFVGICLLQCSFLFLTDLLFVFFLEKCYILSQNALSWMLLGS